MRMTFDQANYLFQHDKINQLCLTPEGLKFLKLRSLSRRAHLERLFSSADHTPIATSATALFREAFEADIDVDKIDSLITNIYLEESKDRRSHERELVSELYQMEVFDWGGLHQNSLEKTIVDNYVKKIRSFELLEQKIENELHQSMRGFVLCQWYNHWTSIIIEDIFKGHPSVLPAVGLVKKIDFFVCGTPFDLKVTYFPEGYIANRRRELNLRPELTLLKKSARLLNLHFDDNLPAGKLLEDIWKKLRDHPDRSAQTVITELQTFRM